jgi:hypothetical protein
MYRLSTKGSSWLTVWRIAIEKKVGETIRIIDYSH